MVPAKFALPDFDHVNHCAYFDYQREKVFLRTSKAVRRACLNRRKRRKRPKLPANREVEIRGDACPFCKGTRITRLPREVAQQDRLRPEVHAGRHPPPGDPLHGRLASVRGLPEEVPARAIQEAGQAPARAEELGHVPARRPPRQPLATSRPCSRSASACVSLGESFMMIRSLMASRYRKTCERILARIVGGELAHADETEVDLQKEKGYVWVLANMEDVLYLYKPSREAAFLQELLKDFKGVLVSDFYSGYDSLACPQQKCLVHLIRDFNTDLMGNPYDEEFKALAAEFGRLLRSIVDTIDKHGLKKRHLHKHKAEVSRFFRGLEARVYRSEVAKGYQARLAKNEGKLFTFLDHDGVPWNNNPAEHAVKAFAYYRETLPTADGRGGALGLPRAAQRPADLQVPGRQLPQVPPLAGGGCRGLLPAGAEEKTAALPRNLSDGFPSGVQSTEGRKEHKVWNWHGKDCVGILHVLRQDRKSGREVWKSGRVNAVARTIAIGDIHGCSTALGALLEAVAPRRQDKVVTLGNSIDHGPDSEGVIRLLLALVSRCTLVSLKGDHEEMLLAAMEGGNALRSWLRCGGNQTLRSYNVDHPRAIPRLHRSFLNSGENSHETDTHLFAHAGYQADQPLKGQPGSVLRCQSLNDVRPGPHVSGKVAVVGHTPQKNGEILNLGDLVCIDTNCHGGGWLTALDVGSGRWWQANEKGEVREGEWRVP